MKQNSIKIGIPTMLMLMLSICLICFSLLSFSSAYSDYKLGNKLLTRTQSYYNACNLAYEKIAEVKHNPDINDREFYFTISDTESLYLKLDSKNPSKVSTWKVISTYTESYDEHLNVIP